MSIASVEEDNDLDTPECFTFSMSHQVLHLCIDVCPIMDSHDLILNNYVGTGIEYDYQTWIVLEPVLYLYEIWLVSWAVTWLIISQKAFILIISKK